MQSATQSTSQGGGSASRGSLEHSIVTGQSHGELASQLSPKEVVQEYGYQNEEQPSDNEEEGEEESSNSL